MSETGVQKEQYMISKWKNGTDESVIKRAIDIADDMRGKNVKVSRVKVESMAHNQGVPQSEGDFHKLISSNDLTGRPYFEFHTKIDITDNRLEHLVQWCDTQKLKYASDNDVCLGISANICGSAIPLLTIRIYNHGRDYSIDIKDEILNNLKKSEFKVIGNIQQEFSIYDNNGDMDRDWLFD